MRSQGVPEAVGASEDVIEADEERNELRVEVGPEQGATWIRAAAARDLSANPPSCLRVHVVSEQIADLGWTRTCDVTGKATPTSAPTPATTAVWPGFTPITTGPPPTPP